LVTHPTGRTQIEGVEKWVLRMMFEPERQELTGEWRKLHADSLRILYYYSKIVFIFFLSRSR
jgi:hypothetical protein